MPLRFLMTLAAFFCWLPHPAAAVLSQADYQDALLKAAKEVSKEADTRGGVSEIPLAELRQLIEDYGKNARSFSLARVTKTYAPALSTVMPQQERALEAAISRVAQGLRAGPGPPQLPKLDYFQRKVAPRRSPDDWSEAAAEYEVRYGGGDNMNWLEVFLDNQVYRLKSRPAPSRFEPIFRFSPAVYQWNTNAIGSLIQIGVNNYFQGKTLKKINPLGIALGLGNPTASFPILGMFDAKGFRAGLILHLKAVDVGFFPDPSQGMLVTTSINFQILRGLF